MEPMHRGYGLPVLVGGTYTVSASWHGDVFVEVSEFFGDGVDTLNLTVLNLTGGGGCRLTSHDPRNYLSPGGIDGQVSLGRVRHKEIGSCVIRGEIEEEEEQEEEEEEKVELRRPLG